LATWLVVYFEHTPVARQSAELTVRLVTFIADAHSI